MPTYFGEVCHLVNPASVCNSASAQPVGREQVVSLAGRAPSGLGLVKKILKQLI